ncbi:MAG TPA: glycosyltransferase family 2 protein [Pyrinomonadaceae bacterium]|nr:glycosyltransferase family 2 protein [Pyrinomonadaceae bacterium]
MKISVAMCTFNGATYLGEQLLSIAGQQRPPDEVVICDDNSTDATIEIATNFARSIAFPVNVHINEQNLGSTKNFERAISLCTGDVIVLADQDDVWLPEKLARIEECFLNEPDAGLVFSDAEVVDDRLRPLGYRLWESVGFNSAQRRLVRSGRVLDVLLPGWTVTGATMAFRARFKDLVLDIPTDLPLIHDGWIALLIASVASVSFIEEPLIKYRQHVHQQIGAKENTIDAQVHGGLAGAREAMQRTNSYDDMIRIGTRAHQRLAERRDIYESDAALTRLAGRIMHLSTRARLPEQTLRRFGCVVRELLTGRYHLYARGFFSAAKDLMRKDAATPIQRT